MSPAVGKNEKVSVTLEVINQSFDHHYNRHGGIIGGTVPSSLALSCTTNGLVQFLKFFLVRDTVVLLFLFENYSLIEN